MPYSHKTGLKNYNPLQMFFSLLQTLRQLPGGTNADRPVSIINHFAGPRALRLSQHAHRRIIHRHGGGFPRPAEPQADAMLCCAGGDLLPVSVFLLRAGDQRHPLSF